MQKNSLFFLIALFLVNIISAQDLDLAFKYYDKGNYEKAIIEFEKLLPLLEEQYGADDTTIVFPVIVYTAFAFENLNQNSNAIKYYKKAQKLLENYDTDNNIDYVYVLYFIGLNYNQLNIFDTAEIYLKKALVSLEKSFGNQNLLYADILADLAFNYTNQKKFKTAENLYLKAIKIYENKNEVQNNSYASILYDFADFYKSIGNYEKAETLLTTALEITYKNKRKDKFTYFQTLEALSEIYINTQKFDKAEENLFYLLRQYKKIYSTNSYEYLKILNLLALLYSEQNNFEKAEKFYSQAIEIQKNLYGTKNITYTTLLQNLASLYLDQQNFDKALAYAQISLNIRKKILSEDDDNFITTYMLLGKIYYSLGDLKTSHNYYNKALTIVKENFGTQNLTYAQILNDLSLVYSNEDNLYMAEKLLFESLNIKKSLLSETNVDYLTSLNNLGTLYFEMGNLKKAEKIFLQVKKDIKSIFDETSPYYANTINNLANLYFEVGWLDSAENLFLKALELNKKIFGVYSEAYATTLSNLSMIYIEKKDSLKALETAKQAAEIKKKILGENNYLYPITLNNLTFAYLLNSDYDNAEKTILKALEIEEKLFGQKNDSYNTYLLTLATIYLREKNYAKALNPILRANSLSISLVKNNFSFMSDNQRFNYWNNNKSSFFIFNSFYLKSHKNFPQVGGYAYDNALFEKGLLLRSSIALNNIILSSGDKNLIDLFERYKLVALQLEKQLQLPKQKRSLNTDSLESVLQNLEKTLLEKSKDFGNFMEAINCSWKDIQNQLDTNEAAIEYLTFRFYDDTDFTNKTIYVAIVLTKNFKYPQIIYLTDQKELEKIFSIEADDEFSKTEMLFEYDYATQIYNLIWKPFDSLLIGIKKIYVSPAGIIYNIPIQALPIDEQKKLVDKYDISLVSTTANILDKNVFSLTPASKVVFFGGINYNKKENSNVQNQQTNNLLNSQFSFFEGKFYSASYLSGTKVEVEELSKLSKSFSFNVALYEDTCATEENFKNLSNGDYKIIHIATHGFYLPDTSNFYFWKNPLNRSGLLFSGANQTFKGLYNGIGDDGILTAEELSNLNFSKTQLIVLSACQTALGDIKGNEGVFGLQRGIKMSGANYMIISLWSVNDYTTMLFMKNFYKNLYQNNDIEQAYLKTIKEIRQGGYFLYGNKVFQKENKQSQVYFWAPFILIK